MDEATTQRDARHFSALLYYSELGSGPPLLLIHGLMVTGEMFYPALDHLAERHRLIVPDLRGHGRSRDLPPPYTTPIWAADLVRVLDHLGIERTAVLGYSEGGAVAQQFAIDYPERCERLVLAATFAYNMASFVEWVEGELGAPLIRMLGMKRVAKFGISASGTDKEMDKEQVERMAGIIGDQDTDKMVLAWRELIAFDSRPCLKDIRCPTLIIAGEKDQALPPHHAKMLREGIPGSKLVVMKDADHVLFWTRTEEFLRLVDQFLEPAVEARRS